MTSTDLALFRYGFGIVTVWLWLASFRTNVVVVVSLGTLATTFFVLRAGNYIGHGLAVETGGYLSLLRRVVRGCVQAVGAPRLALGQALT